MDAGHAGSRGENSSAAQSPTTQPVGTAAAKDGALNSNGDDVVLEDAQDDAVDDVDHNEGDAQMTTCDDVGTVDDESLQLARQRRTPRPLRPLATAADLAENARLKRELAEVHHQIFNRVERSRCEADFWRRKALQLELDMLALREADVAGAWCSAGGATSSRTAAAVAAVEERQQELLALRKKRQSAEQRVEELQANVREAKVASLSEKGTLERMRHDHSQQALQMLTRRTTGPVDTFLSSLPRMDAQALHWVRSQIDVATADLDQRHPQSAAASTTDGPATAVATTPQAFGRGLGGGTKADVTLGSQAYKATPVTSSTASTPPTSTPASARPGVVPDRRRWAAGSNGANENSNTVASSNRDGQAANGSNADNGGAVDGSGASGAVGAKGGRRRRARRAFGGKDG